MRTTFDTQEVPLQMNRFLLLLPDMMLAAIF